MKSSVFHPLAALAVFFVSAFASPGFGQAANYPARPITLIVNSEAGGATDIVARAVQDKLRDGLKTTQPLVIENSSAAGGIVGAALVAKAKPDGYTLLVTGAGPIVFSPLLSSAVTYDPIKDFQYVSLMTTLPSLLVARSTLDVSSLADLVAHAKAHPGRLTYGSSGLGTPSNLSGELFKQLAGGDILHVPYRGSRQAATALLAGEIDIIFSPPTATLPFVQDGKLKALAVTAKDRLRDAPTIPTVAEAGMPALEVVAWFGLMAPQGTPADIVLKLHGGLTRALNDPDVAEALRKTGNTPVQGAGSSEDFARLSVSERERWGKVVKTAGIKID